MCELLALSANRKIKMNKLLNAFFDRSNEHPNGWGLAVFDGNHVSIEREPVKARNSLYLRNRLSSVVLATDLLAHIRKATVGQVEYENTHPFTAKDVSGRTWTLIHNGTIFESPVISAYQYKQPGTTDSERILLYLVDQINKKIIDDMNFFDVNERFKTVEAVIEKLAPENKLNLIIHDGEYLYVHKNDPGTLYQKVFSGGEIFATHPLDDGEWTEFDDNRLEVYKKGQCVYRGRKHSFTYVEKEENIKLLYLGFSGL